METCLCRCPNNSPLNPINSSLESVGGRNNNTLPFTMRWRGCLIPRSPRPRAQSPLRCLPLAYCPHQHHIANPPPLSLSLSFSLMSLMCRCPFVSRFICLSSPISPFPPPFFIRARFFFLPPKSDRFLFLCLSRPCSPPAAPSFLSFCFCTIQSRTARMGSSDRIMVASP